LELEVSETSYLPESLPDPQILTQSSPGRIIYLGFFRNLIHSMRCLLLCPTQPKGQQRPCEWPGHIPSPASCSLVFQTNPLYLLH